MSLIAIGKHSSLLKDESIQLTGLDDITFKFKIL